MRRSTAEKVCDTLGLAEIMLNVLGRPRKRPGESRAEAIDIHGNPMKINPDNYMYVRNMSLPAAFKFAQIEQEYSNRVRKLAEEAVLFSTYPHLFEADLIDIKTYDSETPDTRQIVRDLKAARKRIEKLYL